MWRSTLPRSGRQHFQVVAEAELAGLDLVEEVEVGGAGGVEDAIGAAGEGGVDHVLRHLGDDG